MIRGAGLSTWRGEDGRVLLERDDYTCGHCQYVVVVEPNASVEYRCRQCMAPICERCCGDGRCRPFMKWVEMMETRRYRREQNARATR